MRTETEAKYRRYASQLRERVSTCDALLADVDDVFARLTALQDQHRAVGENAKSLHERCERLVGEKARLLEFADALRAKLHYFDELEKVAAEFHGANLPVKSEQFLPLLRRLDECIAYVNSNPQYADAATYAVKFRQLQTRALGAVRTHVLGVLKKATAHVKAAAMEEQSAADGEGGETLLLYVRFRTAAPDLKTLMEEMEARANRKEYAQLLGDCHAMFCEQRLALLQDSVQKYVDEFAAASGGLLTLTRTGCTYLVQLCFQEFQLFSHFFSESSPSVGGSALAQLMDPLCTILYDVFRPQLIIVTEVDTLCELVDILKSEVMDDQMGRRGDAVAAVRPFIQRTLADVQERLIFRAQAYIRDEVAYYRPTPEDLDFPGKLERAAAEAANVAGAEVKGGAAEGGGQGDDAKEATADGGPLAQVGWYPPLERTLSCLSKLYHSVNPSIFAGLAQEAVALCTDSCQVAGRSVNLKSGVTDGQLFVIRHLLILREQIAPFETDFTMVNKELDFTHMRGQLRRLFAGGASLFGLSTDNGLLALATKGAPRVVESHLDSKKELEKLLKSTCEAFIMSTTKLAVEPMLSFITKVTAVRVYGDKGNSTQPLREQAFATPEKVAEMVAMVNAALKEQLPSTVAKAKLYLTSPSTRAILFKPIKSNIAEAHGQIAALLEEEYTADDVASVGLLGVQELGLVLDGL